MTDFEGKLLATLRRIADAIERAADGGDYGRHDPNDGRGMSDGYCELCGREIGVVALDDDYLSCPACGHETDKKRKRQPPAGDA